MDGDFAIEFIQEAKQPPLVLILLLIDRIFDFQNLALFPCL